jgi:hypothetical protein
MQIPDNMVPLVYLLSVAFIAGVLTFAGVSPEMTGLIIGAGITRVKASPSPASTTPSSEEK